MNTKSYLAVLIIAGLLLYFILHMDHDLHSDIIQSEEQLRFYFADSYQVHQSELIFQYDPNDKPYDQQIARWQKLCRESHGSKLNLAQSQDGHIFGSFDTDMCQEGARLQSVLTAFSFSLNTTERLLFFGKPGAKIGKNEKPGFIFGVSVWFQPKSDGNGIEGCFHKNNNEMGRMMTWLGVEPGKCFPIRKLEQFRVEIGELWNLKNRFDQFLEENDYSDAGN